MHVGIFAAVFTTNTNIVHSVLETTACWCLPMFAEHDVDGWYYYHTIRYTLGLRKCKI